MTRVITTMLIVVAIIHLLPVSGVISAERLAALYGVSFDEPNIEILVRHRAVLFGMLGVFIFYSAFQPKLFLPALIAAAVSVISFLFIAWSVGEYNNEVGRVFMADVVALICIMVAFISYLVRRRGLRNSS